MAGVSESGTENYTMNKAMKSEYAIFNRCFNVIKFHDVIISGGVQVSIQHNGRDIV